MILIMLLLSKILLVVICGVLRKKYY